MTKEEVYKEIKGILLNSEKPSVEINKMIDKGGFDKEPFSFILDLKKIEQNKKYHKEGNVFNHTMLVIDRASELRDKAVDKDVFMMSAFLHDLGKLKATKVRRGRITSYNHDIESSKLVYAFLDGLEDESFIKKVSDLTRYHMQPLYFSKNIKFVDVRDIIEKTETYDLYLLNIADRLGRLDVDEKTELENAKKFLEFLDNKERKYKK